MKTKQQRKPEQQKTATCPVCKRAVTVTPDGNLGTHGPSPAGEFVCPGSGDKGIVKAGSFKID